MTRPLRAEIHDGFEFFLTRLLPPAPSGDAASGPGETPRRRTGP